MSLSNDPPPPPPVEEEEEAAMYAVDNSIEDPTTVWKADVQAILNVIKEKHVSRILELENAEFSNMIADKFPIVENFETPWKFAQSLDQMLVQYKFEGLSMKNKRLIVAEIDKIRKEFVKSFNPIMVKHEYCCGSVWGEKYITRECSCKNKCPTVLVEKNELIPTVFCEMCIDEEDRGNYRLAHRLDYVEMERFICVKCHKELHRACREGFTANCCQQCDPSPFRYNTAATTPTTTTSSTSTPSATCASTPTSTHASSTDILGQVQSTYTKLLSQKRCSFKKPDDLEDAIEFVQELRQKKNLERDEAMENYSTPANFILQIYGHFYSHPEGDILLGLAFVQKYDNDDSRCLIEILSLPTKIPSMKNEERNEILSTFFIEIVKLQRTLVKAVHLRIPDNISDKCFEDSKKLSFEIFSELLTKLPKANIAIKKLKDTLNDNTLFKIPCFSGDQRFDDIISIIHDLGFEAGGKRPKRKTPLTLQQTAPNYISQLTNEIVINGLRSTSKTSNNTIFNETAVNNEGSTISSAFELLKAIQEFHLTFTGIRNCSYATFKIVSFFFDPRLEALSNGTCADSGYSSMNSPSSSITSNRFSNDEVSIPGKKRCSSLADSMDAKKRKIENESNVSVDFAFTASSCNETVNFVMDASNCAISRILTVSSCTVQDENRILSLPMFVNSTYVNEEEEFSDVASSPIDLTTSTMHDSQDITPSFTAPFLSSTHAEEEENTNDDLLVPSINLSSPPPPPPPNDTPTLETCNEQTESSQELPIQKDDQALPSQPPIIGVSLAELLKVAKKITKERTCSAHSSASSSCSSTRDNTPLPDSTWLLSDEAAEEQPPPLPRSSTPGPEVLKWLPPITFNLQDLLAEQNKAINNASANANSHTK